MLGLPVAVRGLAASALQPEFQSARVALRQPEPPAEAVLPMRFREPEPELRCGREPVRERREPVAEPDLESALSKRVAVVVRRKPGHGPARQQRVHASICPGANRLAQCELEPAFRVRPRIPGQRTGKAVFPEPAGCMGEQSAPAHLGANPARPVRTTGTTSSVKAIRDWRNKYVAHQDARRMRAGLAGYEVFPIKPLVRAYCAVMMAAHRVLLLADSSGLHGLYPTPQFSIAKELSGGRLGRCRRDIIEERLMARSQRRRRLLQESEEGWYRELDALRG